MGSREGEDATSPERRSECNMKEKAEEEAANACKRERKR
jgi:hypothetical protein